MASLLKNARICKGSGDYAGRLSAPKSLGARWVTTQKREIAAIHQVERFGDDAIDLLPQRGVFPFDGRDVARLIVQQHGGDFAPGCAFLFAIKRANEERKPAALSGRQSQAAQRRPGALPREATV